MSVGANKKLKPLGPSALGLHYKVMDTGTMTPVTVPIPIEEWDAMPGDGLVWRISGVDGVELGTEEPVRRPGAIRKQVQARIVQANMALSTQGLCLVPSAAFPFASSGKAGCLRLQIGFRGADGFAKLHAAVRLLLPIIPAIGGASPFIQGIATGFHDSLAHGRSQERMAHPELAGSFIPEGVFSQEDYYRKVFGPMAAVLSSRSQAPLDHQIENRRGAIALFDQEVIELRVIDMQECATADLAVAGMIGAVLKALVNGRWVSSYLQRAWSEHDLLPIWDDVVRRGDEAVITNSEYLLMFGLLKQDEMPAAKLWQHLFVDLYGELGTATRRGMAHIMENGCLAKRILLRTGATPARSELQALSAELAECLATDRMFI